MLKKSRAAFERDVERFNSVCKVGDRVSWCAVPGGPWRAARLTGAAEVLDDGQGRAVPVARIDKSRGYTPLAAVAPLP